MKYNIDTKFNIGKLINDIYIYSFNSNINYSDYLYNSLLSILVYCSNDIYSVANICKYARMECNNNVHEKHFIARSYYLTWKYNNKPLAGICYDNMVNSRKNFKYELRRIKLISNQSEYNKIALTLIKDRHNFWKVISNNLKKNNSSTPNNIENEHCIVNITKCWCNYFNNLFNLLLIYLILTILLMLMTLDILIY